MTMYLVLSKFTNSPVSLLTPIKASVFFLLTYTYASAQYINVSSINQKLMCTIKFQAILIYLNLPNGLL
jgi:hypothetical protein